MYDQHIQVCIWTLVTTKSIAQGKGEQNCFSMSSVVQKIILNGLKS